MWYPGRRISRGNDEGSTFLEVLSALALISVLGLILWNAGFAMTGALSRIHREILAGHTLMRLDRTLRESLRDIGIPFWLPSYAADGAEGEFILRSFREGEEPLLIVKNDGAGCVVRTKEREMRFVHVRFSGAAFLENDERLVVGVDFLFTRGNAEPFRIAAAFGGIPLR